jgi:hypothetical protein
MVTRRRIASKIHVLPPEIVPLSPAACRVCGRPVVRPIVVSRWIGPSRTRASRLTIALPARHSRLRKFGAARAAARHEVLLPDFRLRLSLAPSFAPDERHG